MPALILTADGGDGLTKGARLEILAPGEDLRPGAIDAARAAAWLKAGIATEELEQTPPAATPPARVESQVATDEAPAPAEEASAVPPRKGSKG